MKRKFVLSLLVLSLVPAVTFGQAGSPVTRAQVRGELAALRQAGYDGDTETSYPAKLLEAQSRVANAGPRASDTGVGGRVSGSSESGVAARGTAGEIPGLRPLYSGS